MDPGTRPRSPAPSRMRRPRATRGGDLGHAGEQDGSIAASDDEGTAIPEVATAQSQMEVLHPGASPSTESVLMSRRARTSRCRRGCLLGRQADRQRGGGGAGSGHAGEHRLRRRDGAGPAHPDHGEGDRAEWRLDQRSRCRTTEDAEKSQPTVAAATTPTSDQVLDKVTQSLATAVGAPASAVTPTAPPATRPVATERRGRKQGARMAANPQATKPVEAAVASAAPAPAPAPAPP